VPVRRRTIDSPEPTFIRFRPGCMNMEEGRGARGGRGGGHNAPLLSRVRASRSVIGCKLLPTDDHGGQRGPFCRPGSPDAALAALLLCMYVCVYVCVCVCVHLSWECSPVGYSHIIVITISQLERALGRAHTFEYHKIVH